MLATDLAKELTLISDAEFRPLDRFPVLSISAIESAMASGSVSTIAQLSVVPITLVTSPTSTETIGKLQAIASRTATGAPSDLDVQDIASIHVERDMFIGSVVNCDYLNVRKFKF